MITIQESTSLAVAESLTTSSQPFANDGFALATMANGNSPPNSAPQVQLQLSVDGSTWTTVATATGGLQPSKTYLGAWRLADYVSATAWSYLRLSFLPPTGAAITVSGSYWAGTLAQAWDATGLGDYADDTAAAAGGVPVGGLYRNSSAVQVRVA